MNYFNQTKKLIESRLFQVLNDELLLNKDNEIIINNINDFIRLSQDGKRIRGILVALGANLNKENNQNYLDLAVAVELMQTSILIHDDIIDNADTRRGQQTIHAKYKELGIAKAICVGDYGFFLTYKIINNLNIDPIIKNNVYHIFSSMMYNTVLGEIMDVELPHKPQPTKEELCHVYINKTAWYTIIGPLLLGANLNVIDDQLTSQIKAFGTNLGIAFQIKDDIISIISDDHNKCNNSDIIEGKITEMYLYAKDKYQEELKNYGNKNISQVEIDKIKQLFINSKAVDYALKQADIYSEKALTVLSDMDISDESKELLKDLVNQLLTRNK